MELNIIKALLADYYEGKTSREEEALLMDFFKHSEVPSEMKVDMMLFHAAFDSAKEEIPDKYFDEKLFAAIEGSELKQKPVKIRRLLYTVSGIAAGLLLLAGSYFFLIKGELESIVNVYDDYSVDETHIAYEEARDALMLISKVMTTGFSELEALSKMTDATNELNILDKFHQGTKELQGFSKFNEIKDRLNYN